MVSALLHALVATNLTGSGSRARAPLEQRTLTARLMQVTPPVAAARDTVVQYEPSVAQPQTAQRTPKVMTAHALPDAKDADERVVPKSATGEAALAEAPDSTYYATKQLDVYPTLVTPLKLGRTAEAAAASGRALLLVLIDATGAVNDVSLVEPTLATLLEEEARRAFMSARFTPAYRNGRAVKSRMLVEVNYGGEERRE